MVLAPPDGTGDINSPRVVGGRAWGLAEGGATRAFSGPLSLGQTFSIDYDDYGGISPEYFSSIFLLAPGGADVVEVQANRSTDYLIASASLGQVDSGVPETDEGIHIAFTELSAGLQVSITPYVTGATTTILAPYTGQVSAVELGSSYVPFVSNVTPYINNIAITPEPAGLGVLALALPALVARRRPRQA